MGFEQDSFEKSPRRLAAKLPSPRGTPARWHGGQSGSRHVDAGSREQAPASADGPSHPHQAALVRPSFAIATGDVPAATGQRVSRAYLTARPGLQKIEAASIQSYDATANAATIRILGAQSNVLGPVPLAEGLAPGLAVSGALCLVVLLDEANPSDAAIVAMYDAPPRNWIQAGSIGITLSTYQAVQAVTFPDVFASSVAGVSATSRHPDFVATVSGEALGGFTLTVTRREGPGQLQGGVLVVPVSAGATSGSAWLAFPSPFAAIRTVSASSGDQSWRASVSGPAANGCWLSVGGGPPGPATVPVYWQALGDPVVNANVVVDWQAAGA